MGHSHSHRAASAAFLVLVAGCATATRAVYDPEALRADVRARAPQIPPEQVVVPFEVADSQAARARKLVENVATERKKVEVLVEAMFSPRGWNLKYSPRGATTSTGETLERHAGNCLDLASVFIGLSRSAGLRSSYMDASRRVRVTRSVGEGLTVNSGHITAVVETDRGPITLDFSSEGDIVAYRRISDLEAVANFYNNRGFERIEAAEEQGQAPDWARASRDFERATQVFPDFARAWNNLGIAASRLGRREEAMAHYQSAIALDPSFAAPHNNLGLLHLARGELNDAIRELERAATLAPAASHTLYELGAARLRAGDVEGAREALDRAVQLRRDYPEAEALLRSIR